MISDELKKIVDKFNEQGKMVFLPETTDDKISVFENKNNVTLPLQYKKWLCFSDGGEIFLPAGLQLYEVDHKPIIDVNDNDRPSDNYIVIGALASGDPIIFEKGIEKIVIYNHEAGRIEDDSMSRRTSEANKAICKAWNAEQQLVQEGKCTRDWTPEQQKDILEKGKAYDENGKAFEGHHMLNVD